MVKYLITIFLFLLVNLAFGQDPQNGILIKLPPWSEPVLENIDTTKLIRIHINRENRIFIDSIEVQFDSLYNALDLKLNSSKEHLYKYIGLTNEKNTRYVEYLNLYKLLKKIIFDIKNKESMKIFGIEYIALDSSQIKRIDEVIHLSIVEQKTK
ncbi:MAG TPA: hypothetical protein ENK75_06265 [Saprospiraceae bacterium]|nr:hypothetical protein [Saprospiraceae bacterium]